MAKIATLKGATGAQGIQGIQGATGSTGAAGSFLTSTAPALPSAATAGSGAIYWITDAKILVRSDGTRWNSIAPSAPETLDFDVRTVTSIANNTLSQYTLPFTFPTPSAQLIRIRGESFGVYTCTSAGTFTFKPLLGADQLFTFVMSPGAHTALGYHIEYQLDITNTSVSGYIRATFQTAAGTSVIGLNTITALAHTYARNDALDLNVLPSASGVSLTPAVNLVTIQNVVI